MTRLSIVFLVSLCLLISGAWALNVSTQPYTLEDNAQMHGIAIGNGYIYVIGGNRALDADSFRTSYATMSPTGTFGSFSSPSSMRVPTSSNDSGANPNSAYIEFACLAIDSNIYRMGGSWNTNNAKKANNGDSIWATQNPDGTLGSWNVLSPFPTGDSTGGLWGASTYIKLGSGTYIYECGGQSDTLIDNRVYRSKLGTGGSLGSWTTISVMPANMWFPACYASNTNLYVLGMLTTAANTGTSNVVFHTTINPDGSLNAWDTNASLLPVSAKVYGPISGFSKHFAYIIGGRASGGVAQSSTYIATVNPDGTLSSFTDAGSYTINNATTAAVFYTPSAVVTINKQERIMVVGGRYRVPNTATNLVNETTNLLTNAAGVSKGIFFSNPIYTLPGLLNGSSLNLKPGEVVTLQISGGTAPFGSWTSGNGTIGALSGIGGTTAVFSASSTNTGITVISFTDAYGDQGTITINVTPTSAPLVPDTQVSSAAGRIKEIKLQ